VSEKRNPKAEAFEDLGRRFAHGSPNGDGHEEAQADGAESCRLEDVATLDDLAKECSAVKCLWEGWIQEAVLHALAAEGGTGKTRFCADLVRRIRHRLPWPDGKPMTLPRDAPVLWVPADNNHAELVTLATDFGIREHLYLNAPKKEPYGGVTLETLDDLAALDARVAAVKPVLLVVDTVGNATEKNLSRQEEATAFYQPLQLIARRHGCAVLCLTHLNASGKFLGRRVIEKVRVAIKMSQPDAQDDRRRLEVYKTNARRPAPLGLTMFSDRNEYDAEPPAEGGGEPGQAAASRKQECRQWLAERLGDGMAHAVKDVRKDAEHRGYGADTLYKAKRELGVEEFVMEGRKQWQLSGGG
jgi:hypothetical protein